MKKDNPQYMSRIIFDMQATELRARNFIISTGDLVYITEAIKILAFKQGWVS